MRLPQELLASLEVQLKEAVVNVATVSGGCISNTARLDLQSGERMFLKWAEVREQPRTLFALEAMSLRAIAATHTVRVPLILGEGGAADFSWLLLEWLEPGARTQANQSLLGHHIAQLHRHRAERYGWPADNFIGSLPQSNRPCADWPEFWRTERMLPQLQMAHNKFNAAQHARFAALLDRCDELIGEAQQEGPSLLHGDLWGGNVHMLADGAPAVIDPASYYGHREVDLAMAKLFGGFGPEFYAAYNEVWRCQPGVERRLLMYQLYYLLVHVNLFGGSYVTPTLAVLDQLG